MSVRTTNRFMWVALCRRCGLTAKVPALGRDIYRLGPCPSCDMVSWDTIEKKRVQ